MANRLDGDGKSTSISSSQGSFCQSLKKAHKGPFVIGVAGGTASGKVSFVCDHHYGLIVWLVLGLATYDWLLFANDDLIGSLCAFGVSKVKGA